MYSKLFLSCKHIPNLTNTHASEIYEERIRSLQGPRYTDDDDDDGAVTPGRFG
jgi:hypothetical protein